MDMLSDGSPYVPQVPSYLKTRMIKMLETKNKRKNNNIKYNNQKYLHYQPLVDFSTDRSKEMVLMLFDW